VRQEQPGDSRGGLLYGLAAYGLWGVMPLYFWVVKVVPPLELLAHRIVWSVLFLAMLLTALGRWGEVARCLRVARTRWLLLASTALVALNWYAFIYGVSVDRVVDTSLGYFVNPLVSILFGVLLFGERLGGWKWLALALASGGIIYLVVALGQVPWIALVVAFSFGLYGVVRKVAPVDGLVGLSVETLLLLPAAGLYLAVVSLRAEAALGGHGPAVDALLLASGVVTAVPLMCFGEGARRIRLSTLGFLQYLAPTAQLLLAVLVFREPFPPAQQACFGCIWSALAIVTADSLLAQRRRAGPPGGPAPAGLPDGVGRRVRQRTLGDL
jgi:chloramphenicol-sensitive protein RarD